VQDEDGRDETARRARRIRWGIRLVFYPAAIAIAVALLAARGGGDGELGGYLHGTTSQDLTISFDLNAENEPTQFDSLISATCPNGEVWRVRWWEAERLATSFRRDDSRLEVDASEPMDYTDGQRGVREFTLRAEVHDDRAEGELTFVERLRTPDGLRYECASGKVRFTAQR
jgi:hypothetical protein